ncbi:MAG: hypothetical protein AAF821_12660 [Cyanobacteria bacterium P01_D01_bin.156]
MFPDYVRMWIISTILEKGDIEEAIAKALAMKAQRPSYLPPQGFLLSILNRIGNHSPSEVTGVVDVPVIDRS